MLFLTCGFVPLCRKVRFPEPDALTCWEYYHSEPDVMNGRCETLCYIKNPNQMLGRSPEGMALGSIFAHLGTERTAVNLGSARLRQAPRGEEIVNLMLM
jgi:hypothetical protein